MSISFVPYQPNEIHAIRFVSNCEVYSVNSVKETMKEVVFLRKAHGLEKLTFNNDIGRLDATKFYIDTLCETEFNPLVFGCRIETVDGKKTMKFDGWDFSVNLDEANYEKR